MSWVAKTKTLIIISSFVFYLACFWSIVYLYWLKKSFSRAILIYLRKGITAEHFSFSIALQNCQIQEKNISIVKISATYNASAIVYFHFCLQHIIQTEAFQSLEKVFLCLLFWLHLLMLFVLLLQAFLTYLDLLELLEVLYL
jgi:hypothetical protein